MSRMMARDTTIPAPVDKPCTARKKISCPMLCDSAHPTEATVKAATPQSTTGRRPKLSEMAPWNRLMKAKPNRYADRVCCNCTADASNDFSMSANAGK